MPHINKLAMTLIIAAYFLIHPAQTTAQSSCIGLPLKICGKYKSCNWVDNSCVPNQSMVPGGVIGKFSDMSDTLNASIGLNSNLTTMAGIINALVPILLILGGLILFLMLISGGFTMLTSATNPDQAQKGKQQITTAITGFLIIFAAYWIVQALEIFLGINIF